MTRADSTSSTGPWKPRTSGSRDLQRSWARLAGCLEGPLDRASQLRDRLTVNLAAHLGAQLPLLIRGIYYDQFEPGRMPSEQRSRDDFMEEVADGLAYAAGRSRRGRPVRLPCACTAYFGRTRSTRSATASKEHPAG